MACFLIVFFIRFLSLEKQNRVIMQKLLTSSTDKSGKRIDPYIQKQVKNTVKKYSSQILECYREFLGEKPVKQSDKKDTSKYSGKVKMDWHIDKDGGVISPEIIISELNQLTPIIWLLSNLIISVIVFRRKIR